MASDAKEINAVIEELNIKKIEIMHELMLTVLKKELNVDLTSKQLVELENYNSLYYFLITHIKDHAEDYILNINEYSAGVVGVIRDGFFDELQK